MNEPYLMFPTTRKLDEDPNFVPRLRVIRIHLKTQTDPNWPNCPDCGQSATCKYASKPACSRCGWRA